MKLAFWDKLGILLIGLSTHCPAVTLLELHCKASIGVCPAFEAGNFNANASGGGKEVNWPGESCLQYYHKLVPGNVFFKKLFINH